MPKYGIQPKKQKNNFNMILVSNSNSISGYAKKFNKSYCVGARKTFKVPHLKYIYLGSNVQYWADKLSSKHADCFCKKNSVIDCNIIF